MAQKTITAKILQATTTHGTAVIVVELTDGEGTWQKTYTQQTEVIKADHFKNLVASDVRKDLKKAGQLDEISPLVGKTFTFTI